MTQHSTLTDEPSLFDTPRSTSAVRELERLHADLRQRQVTPLQLWIREYAAFKETYTRFRAIENGLLYSPTAAGDAPTQPAATMCLLRAITVDLLQSGGRLVETLRGLKLDEDEAPDRPNWELKAEILLSALRETLEIWHPANTEAPDAHNALRQLFAE